MSRRRKVLQEQKVKAVEEYLLGSKSMAQIGDELGVSPGTVENWIGKYKASGPECFTNKVKNKYYSSEFKLQAITDYIDGKGSIKQICFSYNISSDSMLRKWIKEYNSHKILKPTGNKGANIMTTARKTSYKERIEIVTFCIANANDYKLTADKYDVSYQQVYGWVKKYETNGFDALVDRRGMHKVLDELNESEKYTMKLKLLEAENRQLKMENDFLKKLKEIEGR